ncbi:NUDIX hydrolase [Arthrobacter tumbae]|uniref:NUDIX hydrolase n=1 Tax=Arthrobacter tumbae TaxID=163874 RepID=UPI00195B36FF|nr:NUDIX domain-containing protein [Arthrobacter tumbae]MBM7781780.1 8-oxo-dGTP pyrophosphatase MutT (NUDIX family) [Arthrobacter tumbae]
MGLNLLETAAAELEEAWAAHADPIQRDTLERVSLHLDEHGRHALAKAGHPVHLTASCFVFDEMLEQTLLTFHRKGQFWVQLGGHIEDQDASLREAARREFREESGISAELWFSTAPLDADIHDVSSAFGTCRTHVDLAFGAVVPRDSMIAVSEESDDLSWRAVTDLPSGAVPGLAGRAERIRKLIRHEQASKH